MPDSLLIAFAILACMGVGAALAGRLAKPTPLHVPHVPPSDCPHIAIGTVRTVAGPIVVDVESVSGQSFVGRLRRTTDDPSLSELQPGAVLLVAFDPHDRERLELADDMVAVRASFDQMLVRKGLVTPRQLDLIRHGTRSRGVITAVRSTGGAREDYREVELDLMVRRLDGGQFAARETALIPESALPDVTPGSTVDAYYRGDDETVVAVCVPPN